MLLTVNSMHFISLTAPKHPKNANKQTRAEVMTSTYTAPEKRFVPNSSLRKLRSMSVIKPITNTIAPPSCNEKSINGLEPVFIAVVDEWIISPFFFCIAVVMKKKRGEKGQRTIEYSQIWSNSTRTFHILRPVNSSYHFQKHPWLCCFKNLLRASLRLN